MLFRKLKRLVDGTLWVIRKFNAGSNISPLSKISAFGNATNEKSEKMLQVSVTINGAALSFAIIYLR